MWMSRIQEIAYQLDEFVANRGCGSYVSDPQTRNTTGIDPNNPIQQIREEILYFAEILLKTQYKNVLEIGAGTYGGTHYLWKMIFEEVTSVDFCITLPSRLNYEIEYPQDVFVIADSFNIKTRELISKRGPFDVLFIDGGHGYENITGDYLLYKDLVHKGGMIAFHDTNANMGGINQFMEELFYGKIDGVKHNPTHIFTNRPVRTRCGISYIKV